MSYVSHIQVQEQKFHCKACGAVWVGEILAFVTIPVWVAHVKSIRCPKCHANSHKLSFCSDQYPHPVNWPEAEREAEPAAVPVLPVKKGKKRSRSQRPGEN